MERDFSSSRTRTFVYNLFVLNLVSPSHVSVCIGDPDGVLNRHLLQQAHALGTDWAVSDTAGRLATENNTMQHAQGNRRRGADIKVNVSSLQHSGQAVTVSWRGVSHPSRFDWVGVYSPPDAQDRDFLSYINATQASAWATGEGELSVRLFNLRAGYSFRYFTVGLASNATFERACEAISKGPLLYNCSQTLTGGPLDPAACCASLALFLRRGCACSGAAQSPLGETRTPMRDVSKVTGRVVEFDSPWARRATLANAPQWTPCNTPDGRALDLRVVTSQTLRCTDAPPRRGQANLKLASSPPIEWDRPKAPMYTKLALTGIKGELRITWISSVDAQPVVRVGVSPGMYTMEFAGSTRTYSAQDMCGSPANETAATLFRDPGFVHDVQVPELLPGVVYYYQHGAKLPGGMSDESTLKGPAPPDAESRVYLLATSNVGTDDPYSNFWRCPGSSHLSGTAGMLANEAKSGLVDAALVMGDLSFALGHHFLWDVWDTTMEPLTSLVPTHISVGDHEHCRDPSRFPAGDDAASYCGDESLGECSVPVASRYSMPANGRAPFWYAFEVGPVKVIAISTEHPLHPQSAQHEWLKWELSLANRLITPWVVVMGHRPLYLSQCGADGDCAYEASPDRVVGRTLQSWLEPLMMQYGVNLYLSGHVRAYARTCPLHMGRCQPPGKGTVHVTAGNGGCTLSGTGVGGDHGNLWEAYSPLETNYTEAATMQFGYLRIWADSNELAVHMTTHDDKEFDKVSIPPWEFTEDLLQSVETIVHNTFRQSAYTWTYGILLVLVVLSTCFFLQVAYDRSQQKLMGDADEDALCSQPPSTVLSSLCVGLWNLLICRPSKTPNTCKWSSLWVHKPTPATRPQKRNGWYLVAEPAGRSSRLR